MKRNVRRMLQWIGLLILPLFMVSCGGSCGGKRPPISEDGKEHITIWASSWTQQALEKISTDFEAANPDIKVSVKAINWSDMQTKLLAAISSGHDVPDVTIVSSAWSGGIISTGGLEPLDHYLEGKQSYLATFLPESLKIYQYKGKQYGIPLDLDLMVMFYRSDIIDPVLKKLGMAHFPETWDDFVKLGKAVTTLGENKEGKRYALSLSASDPYTLYAGFMTQNGANYFTDDLKEPIFDRPEAVAALQFYIDLIKKHKVALQWTASFGDTISALKSGLITMYPIGPWYREEMKVNLPEMKGKWKIALMPTPTGKGPYTALTGICMGIPFNSEHKDAAMKYIEFFTSNKAAMLDYFKQVGSPIPIVSLWDDPAFKAVDPYFQQPIYDTILKGVRNSKPIQIVPQQKILDIFGVAQEAAVRGDKTAEQALKEAAAEARNYLK